MPLLILPLLAAALAGAPDKWTGVPTELRACGDSSEYPPFTYVQRKHGQPTGTVIGYNVDYLQAALAGTGRTVSFELLPWKRCVALTMQGKFDFVLDSGGSARRGAEFRLTQPHYLVHSVVVFAKDRPIPVLKSREDFERLKRCEILGWDSSNAVMPRQDESKAYPSNLQAGYSMLRHGRCETMVTQREVVESLKLVDGQRWFDGLEMQQVPWLGETGLRYGVSRATPYSAALHAMLDEGADRIRKSGEAERIAARYFVPPASATDVPRELRACGDVAGFPPYTMQRDGAAAGYNVDYLRALFAHQQRKVSITLLPWKRCLLLAEKGQYDLLLDAGDLPERHARFEFTPAMYGVTPVFLYMADRKPPSISRKEDLAALRRCEIADWNFLHSGTREGSELVVHPSSAEAGLAMLRHGRCAVMLYHRELLGDGKAPEGMAYQPIPWRKTSQMYIGVSRALRYAQPLHSMLVGGMEDMRKSGEAARLLARYLPK